MLTYLLIRNDFILSISYIVETSSTPGSEFIPLKVNGFLWSRSHASALGNGLGVPLVNADDFTNTS